MVLNATAGQLIYHLKVLRHLPALQRLPSASDAPVQQVQHFLHLLPEPPF